tara:strand:- start:2445 stop:3371 length:927 start_codon:yes stop_codon:yes gene_type:complete
MIKKKILTIILFISILINHYSSAEVFIVTKVNDIILTNLDIEKEASYLKILNPELKKLNKKDVFKISKESLVNQSIKKNELERFFAFEKELTIINEILNKFFVNLGYMDENEFENMLNINNTYSIREIKEKMKIEFFWNRLILEKFKDSIKIDYDKLNKKIKKVNQEKTRYLLSEIFFYKDNSQSLKNQVKIIKKSIVEIGFKNTASMYSQSESAKVGGKIGWIEEESLSEKILEELKKIKIGEHSNVISFGNNFLILKIEDKKKEELKRDREEILKKMINFEKEKQLNQFSNIYFNKIKINFIINEK